MEKSPFTNVHDVKEKAHRAFANISDDVVKRCIAHTVDQENFYRYLHNMEPCTPEVVETIPETVDVQSDSDLIEQDPIEEIIVRDQDQQMVASLPSDSSFVEPDSIEDNVVDTIIEVDIEHIEAPEDPIHVCSACDYKTPSSSRFAKHVKALYICNYCDKSFHGMHGKRDYDRHVKKHEKSAKPEFYKCSKCKKPFSKLFNLNKHIKVVHNSLEKMKKTYNCSLCNKKFAHLSRLNQHLRMPNVHEKSVHKSPTNCLICGKTFSFPSVLKRHTNKKNCSKSKKNSDHELTFDAATTIIPVVVEGKKSENDNIATDTSFSNNEQTKKSRRKQNFVLRNDC